MGSLDALEKQRLVEVSYLPGAIERRADDNETPELPLDLRTCWARWRAEERIRLESRQFKARTNRGFGEAARAQWWCGILIAYASKPPKHSANPSAGYCWPARRA